MLPVTLAPVTTIDQPRDGRTIPIATALRLVRDFGAVGLIVAGSVLINLAAFRFDTLVGFVALGVSLIVAGVLAGMG